MVFFDVNYEEGDVKVSPPLKYFASDFLEKLLLITADEGGLIVFNTIIAESNDRKKVVQALRAANGCAKFSSKMEEDLNEVFYLAKGTYDRQASDRLDDTDNRVQRFGQVINALKLPRGILLNKQKMKVTFHVE